MIRTACIALLSAGWLAAQAPSDPMQLQRLQSVLQRAMQRVSPSVVRVETFGGARRALAADPNPGDAANQRAPLRYGERELKQLFDKIDPDELGRLWLERGLDPKPADDPFEAKDLSQLGDEVLRELFDRYDILPDPPRPQRQARPQAPPQPGFLQAQGATTGLVLSADGWILVSRFALSYDPGTILIRLPDGRSFSARRAGEDQSRGIALVKIEAEGLPVPEFVAPAEVRVGSWAFALGRTFAPDGPPSPYMGIVSATDRLFGRAIQIDTATSPANYGGPVIDLRGRVLGIAAPLSPSGRDAGVDWYDSGIGFATTIVGIEPLLERMKSGEILQRGWLGVRTDPRQLGPGALVDEVVPDSPADAAMLLPGDRILRVDDVEVRNLFHLQMLLGARLADERIHLELRRGDELLEPSPQLAALPAAQREARQRSEETFQLPWDGDDPAQDR